MREQVLEGPVTYNGRESKMHVKTKRNCDILVVGGGNAALVAAIEARNAGAKVLLVEKAPRKVRGGNSRLSWGLFNISAQGMKDYKSLLDEAKLPKGELEIEPYPKDDFYNKAMSLSEGLSDKRLTEIVVNKSLETVLWMKEQGIQWELDLRLAYKKGNRVFWPAGHAHIHSGGSGESLVEKLYGIVENRNIEVLYGTAAHSLIMNGEGRVCGIFAKCGDGLIEIGAKNVILACGGFQANPAWRRSCLGENWDLVKLRGTRYNTGEGIKMAFDIGAQLTGHWGGCHASIVSEDSPMIEATSAGSERYSYPLGVMINRDGKRFVDEGEDFVVYTYAKFGKEILQQPGGVAFQIFDAKVTPLLRVEYQNVLKVESYSLEELGEELCLNVEQFLATIEAFNEAIVNEEKPFAPYTLDGRDTRGLKINKTNWAQKIDTPPYQAYAVVCGLTMTYGGLKTNERAQVIDTSDHPIKGLYAVGEVTGGFFYHNYPAGTGLVRGAVMGRIAGAESTRNL
jgi:tricarballylate dehydrogenase